MSFEKFIQHKKFIRPNDDLERQIRAYAQKVADARIAARDARIRTQVANLILRSGGSLHPEQITNNILRSIYQQIQWRKDGHK